MSHNTNIFFSYLFCLSVCLFFSFRVDLCVDILTIVFFETLAACMDAPAKVKLHLADADAIRCFVGSSNRESR